ncbi:MAG: hypothetical protein KDI50_10805, partial [Candidatus Competibacteraceae bacterium]|nr:hypothetical protein [Candidatus Competibacteraceae bacterium]
SLHIWNSARATQNGARHRPSMTGLGVVNDEKMFMGHNLKRKAKGERRKAIISAVTGISFSNLSPFTFVSPLATLEDFRYGYAP